MINVNSLASLMARRCTVSSSRTAASSHLTRASSSTTATANTENKQSMDITNDAASITTTPPVSSSMNVNFSSPLFGSSLLSSQRYMSTLPFRDVKAQSKNISNPLLSMFSKLTVSSSPSTVDSSIGLASPTISQKRTFASKKHKRIIKMAKGYRGRANRTFRAAIRRVEKGLQYSYRDRKVKRRNYRKLWIERINAGVRQHGISYSRFINGMATMNEDGEQGIKLNRKVLAEMAANEPFSFKAVVDVVKMKSIEK